MAGENELLEQLRELEAVFPDEVVAALLSRLNELDPSPPKEVKNY
ncbi:hypothetical protein M7I_6563 [Glarea lozoyensis 74030]|uniref:Uncharacterized protein n=1 Tax=Glarea lozoyensis (strain ATCC 74030 / MF5533) TaxID=1104152 RepID=H0EUX3_GLAL7|nr:hypothetical protein M7I_6563 [Glarea lozoyensis 74030]